MLDLVIKGGRVVTPHGIGEYDVAVRGERIISVSLPSVLTEEARRVIDAKGKIVVPGGIEPHSHSNMPLPHQPNLRSQKADGTSRACAFGGTTTVVDFAGHPAVGDPLTNIDAKLKEYAGNSYVDFAFHCTLLGEVPFEYIEQIPEVISKGLASIKVFTNKWPVYRDPTRAIGDGRMAEVMEIVARHGGILAIHAENDKILSFNIEKLKREGREGVENVHLAHSNLSEEVEFRKLINMAEHTRTAIYFVHTSAKEGVEAVAEARAKGLPIYGETIHNYLAFDIENLKEPDGVKYLTHPGQKYPEDREALWAGIIDGRMSTVGTDDVTTYKDAKLVGKNVIDAMGGHNGVETRVPYMFSEGVSKGRLSLERFVDVTSTNVAKVLGMYPQKGAIAPGSDADIVIIDPNVHKKLTLADLHSDSDYSIWEGWEFHGWPMVTILRGKVIVEGGKLKGSLKDGKFVARKIAPKVLAGPAC